MDATDGASVGGRATASRPSKSGGGATGGEASRIGPDELDEDEFERELRLLNEATPNARRISSSQPPVPLVGDESAPLARSTSVHASGIASTSTAPRALATRNASDRHSGRRPPTPPLTVPKAEPFTAAFNREHDILESPRSAPRATSTLLLTVSHPPPAEQAPASIGTGAAFKSVLDDPTFNSVLDDPLFQ